MDSFEFLSEVAKKTTLRTVEDVKRYFDEKKIQVGECILRKDPRSAEKEAYVLSMQGHNGNIMHLKIKKKPDGKFEWNGGSGLISFEEAGAKLRAFVESKRDKAGPNRHLVIGERHEESLTLAEQFERQLQQTEREAIRTVADVERYFKDSLVRQWTFRKDPKSSEERAYVLSMKGYNDKITHLKIKKSAEEGKFEWSGSQEAFSLEEMLAKLSAFTEWAKNKTGESVHLVMGEKQRATPETVGLTVKERTEKLRAAQQKSADKKPESVPREIDAKYREAEELGISSQEDLEDFFKQEGNSGRLIVRKEESVSTLSMRCDDGRVVHMRLRESTHDPSKFEYGPGKNNTPISFVEARQQLEAFKTVVEKSSKTDQQHFYYGGVKKKKQRDSTGSELSRGTTRLHESGEEKRRELLFRARRNNNGTTKQEQEQEEGPSQKPKL